MAISKIFDPSLFEDKWYKHWEESGFFKSTPDDREAYTIVIPPPNVTGVLHMGHMLNNTIQDVLIRRARLLGYNACWVPGTDHASIATEAKVVGMLRERGIKKSDLTREEFLKYAWEWKEKHGGIILEQLKKLGASCDWDRTRFTMDDDMSDAVITVFVDLYNKGHIYKGLRIINWDSKALTALSNEEVFYKDVTSKLYYVKYKIFDSNDFITIATTRPETILGDTAICINPSDERFSKLRGKYAVVPLIGRKIPIIEDTYVDMEFGTGALKITPGHDPNDYELGKKHNLETINILDENGTLKEAAQLYIGEDRFKARKLIVADLEKEELIEKIEEFQNSVGYSERTDVIVEPRLSEQWFLDMTKLAKPALENVMNNQIRFFPSKFKNTYKHWMENIREWCLSRQLWWGQRVPAYYFGENEFVVAESPEKALELAKAKSGNNNLTAKDLKQDEDVLDTWASSWLWPISVFDGFKDPKNKDISYYYPTNVLVTAPEILFFWVARMIMAGYEYRNELPFKDVYLTGIVRDKKRRKMSKSLGNSPDPLDLIKKYGADGVRTGMLFSSPAGGDLLFDEKLCEQGRNFSNKIWNALRLIQSWDVTEGQNEELNEAIEWFENKLNAVIEQVDEQFENYKVSDVLITLYNFFWNDFASWYLEMIKPKRGEPIDKNTYVKTINFFEVLMKLLHPFMPFITEEIWHVLSERKNNDCIMVTEWPKAKPFNQKTVDNGDVIKDLITKIREIKSKANMKNIETVDCFILSDNAKQYQKFKSVIIKCANLGKFENINKEPSTMTSFVIKGDTFYVETGVKMDIGKEKEKISAEISYIKGFIDSVNKKLSNKRFVDNAPEKVIDMERLKLHDGMSKLKSLEDALKNLN